jgi:hypothetical protein
MRWAENFGTIIKVNAQPMIPLKSLFAIGDKLETSCKQPSHLTKNLASGVSVPCKLFQRLYF